MMEVTELQQAALTLVPELERANLAQEEVKLIAGYGAGLPLEPILEESGLTIFAWFMRIGRRPELAALWEKAKAARALYHVMKVEELADTLPASKANVALQARQWLAARLAPTDWSERHQDVSAVSITINTTLGQDSGSDPISAGKTNTYTLEARPMNGSDAPALPDSATRSQAGGTPQVGPSRRRSQSRGPQSSPKTPKSTTTRSSKAARKKEGKA